MNSLEKHTARGQALGYFFQLERALSWLSIAPAGAIIGIETEDDVVVELLSGKKIYEQDKSSTTTNFPFEARQKDFWKTLLIWLEALKEREIQDKETPSFYMVTNKIADTNQIVNEISCAQNEKDALIVVEKLRTIAAIVPNGIKDIVQKVINFNDRQLAYLVSRIQFVDGSTSIDKTKIISDLQLPEADTEYYINTLSGYIFNTLTENWRNGQPGKIFRDDFMRLKNKLIQEHFNDFFNEESIKLADIASEADAEIEYSNKYIRQLKLIDADEDEIFEAIEDYLRSSKAKTEMARKGYLWEKAFLNMNDELRKRWLTISRQKRNLQTSNKLTDIELGKDILYSTLDHKATINGYPTRNYFLTKGSYHYLANELIVGWHPNYETLIKEEKNEADS